MGAMLAGRTHRLTEMPEMPGMTHSQPAHLPNLLDPKAVGQLFCCQTNFANRQVNESVQKKELAQTCAWLAWFAKQNTVMEQ